MKAKRLCELLRGVSRFSDRDLYAQLFSNTRVGVLNHSVGNENEIAPRTRSIFRYTSSAADQTRKWIVAEMGKASSAYFPSIVRRRKREVFDLLSCIKGIKMLIRTGGRQGSGGKVQWNMTKRRKSDWEPTKRNKTGGLGFGVEGFIL